MSSSDRKAELERKKAKLAALRDIKSKRERLKVDINNGSTDSLVSFNSSVGLREEAEEILKTLGIPAVSENNNASSEHCLSRSSSSIDILHRSRTASPRRRKPLGFSQRIETSVPPKENVSYSKHTQTIEHSLEQQVTDHGVESPRTLIGSPKSMACLEWDDEFSVVLPFDGAPNELMDVTVHSDAIKMPLVGMVPAALTPADRQFDSSDKQAASTHVLSDEERAILMDSDGFQRFFDRASRLIERAFEVPSDMFIDYTGADREEAGLSKQRQLLQISRDFFDERWSRRRTVTCLDWSKTFPELLLASYHTNEDAPHEPDGVCLIWNLKFKKNTPEYVFHCQSAVTAASLTTFHPNLVIGGTYSGQIVLWDSRSNKRTPVQRTPLLATAHTHPVHAVTVVGSQNAHNLISLSSDGRLCAWSLDMLAQPQQAMELIHRQTRHVSATSLSFLAEDSNNFLVGSEDDRTYAGSRHGSKAGITEMFEGHQGPITSVRSHTMREPIDFSTLFLTTALDWSVKLWSTKETRPIHSFDDAFDYVYDADWSPLHPAIFVTGDGTGRLDLWNLNSDTEVPTERIVLDGQPAINKCRFHSSGLHVAAGDDNGRIHICDLKEVMVTPRSIEWNLFANTINELRNFSQEQRETDADRSIQTAPTVLLPPATGTIC